MAPLRECAQRREDRSHFGYLADRGDECLGGKGGSEETQWDITAGGPYLGRRVIRAQGGEGAQRSHGLDRNLAGGRGVADHRSCSEKDTCMCVCMRGGTKSAHCPQVYEKVTNGGQTLDTWGRANILMGKCNCRAWTAHSTDNTCAR